MRSALLFLVAVAWSTATSAQTTTRTPVPGKQPASPVASAGGARPAARNDFETQPTDAALTGARIAAACVVKRRPNDVRSVLSATSWRQFTSTLARLKGTLSACAGKVADKTMTVTLRFKPSGMIGVLAEAWFRENGAPTLTATAYAPRTSSLEWISDDPSVEIVQRLAACLAATRPDLAAAIVRVGPASADETSSFKALTPLIPSCLETNVTLATNRAGLRFALAAALYRRAFVPQDAASVRPSSGRGSSSETVLNYALVGDVVGYAAAAACIVGQEPERARKAVESYLLDRPDYPMLLLANRHKMCQPASGSLTTNSYLFVTSVAEAVVKHNDPSLKRLDGATLTVDVAEDPTLAFAICAIRAAPADVRAIFQSNAGSRAEAAAMRQLAQKVTSCPLAVTERTGRLAVSAVRTYVRSKLALAAFEETMQ